MSDRVITRSPLVLIGRSYTSPISSKDDGILTENAPLSVSISPAAMSWLFFWNTPMSSAAVML